MKYCRPNISKVTGAGHPVGAAKIVGVYEAGTSILLIVSPEFGMAQSSVGDVIAGVDVPAGFCSGVTAGVAAEFGRLNAEVPA